MFSLKQGGIDCLLSRLISHILRWKDKSVFVRDLNFRVFVLIVNLGCLKMCVQALEQLQHICTHWVASNIWIFKPIFGAHWSLLCGPCTTRFSLKVNKAQNPLKQNIFSRVFPGKFSVKQLLQPKVTPNVPHLKGLLHQRGRPAVKFPLNSLQVSTLGWRVEILMRFTANSNIKPTENSQYGPEPEVDAQSQLVVQALRDAL